jgi:uncharacterized damage-inducible protein DinB
MNPADRAILEHFEADDEAAFEASVPGQKHTADRSPTRWNGRERLLCLIAHELHHRGEWILTLRHAGFTNLPVMALDW